MSDKLDSLQKQIASLKTEEERIRIRLAHLQKALSPVALIPQQIPTLHGLEKPAVNAPETLKSP